MKNKLLKNDHFTKEDNISPMHKGPGIAPRLFFMIFALLTLMVISSLVAFWRNRTVHDAFEKILYEIPHERAINDVQTAITDYIMPANDYLITADPIEIENRDILEEKVGLAFIECYRLARDAEKPLVKRVEDDFANIKDLSDEIFSFNASTDRELAGRIMKKMDKLAIDSRIHVRDLLKMHDLHMESAYYDAEQAWRSSWEARLWRSLSWRPRDTVSLFPLAWVSTTERYFRESWDMGPRESKT